MASNNFSQHEYNGKQKNFNKKSQNDIVVEKGLNLVPTSVLSLNIFSYKALFASSRSGLLFVKFNLWGEICLGMIKLSRQSGRIISCILDLLPEMCSSRKVK